jgi:hypothetical protein
VGLALVLPIVLDLVSLAADSLVLGMLGALSAFVGGFVLRLGVLSAGVEETPPLYKLASWRAAHPPAEGIRRPALPGDGR